MIDKTKMDLKLTVKDGESMDIVEKNVEALAALFPSIFKEGKIDIEILKEELGEFIEDKQEKFTFGWNGKSKTKKGAQIPSMETLRPDAEASVNFETTENVIISGDNLEVLKILQKSYFKKIKMIYIDPPYNTGKDFVYKDNFAEPNKAYKEQTGELNEDGKAKSGINAETSGRYHTNWLNMMYPRLYLAKNLLKEDGVIFISIDDHEVANLRLLMNEIFGEENFVGEFVWRKTDNQANIGNMARVKEYIICYCKNVSNLKLNKMKLTERAKKEYRYSDVKGNFRRAILLDKTRGRNIYEVITPSGKTLNGPWMIKEEDFKNLEKDNGIYWATGGEEQPYGKTYLEDSKGQITNDFLGIEFGTNQEGSIALEKLFDGRCFDFPKPVSLIKHFITIGTSDDDIVLDFFAGSGTTGQAVMKLNAEDGGSRKFILVQLPEETNENSEAFKAGYKTIDEITRERIRRVITKIQTSQTTDKKSVGLFTAEETSESQPLDLGFKAFHQDTSNLNIWDPSWESLENDLLKSVDNIKQKRSEDDLLFEFLLKKGLPLTMPINSLKIAGHSVFESGDFAIVICFDDNLSLEFIKELASKIKESNMYNPTVIFKDSCFKDDIVKTNAITYLQQVIVDSNGSSMIIIETI